MDLLKTFFEKHTFGICQYIGDQLGISADRIRTYFIYLSFGTLGSPVVIYLFLAFWLNIRKYLRNRSYITG